MGTYLELQQDIISDLKNRSDLLARVKIEIGKRIQRYQGEAFVASEGEDTSISTIDNTSVYPLPSSILQVTGAWVNYAGVLWTPLEPKAVEWINTQNDVVPPVLSIPAFYAIFKRQLYLYPTPFDAWTIKLDGLMTIPTLINDTDVNFWTTEGAELIRNAVVERMASQYLGMTDLSSKAQQLKEDEYQDLLQKSANTSGTGMIEGHWS